MGNHNLHNWTVERVERLRELASQGKSAGQIAAALGGITRSAVIGKMARLGIRGSVKPAPKPWIAAGMSPRSWYRARAKANQRLALPQRAPIQSASAAPAVKAMPANPVTLLQLEYHHCRWPLGEPSSDMLYCGAHKHGDRAYCLEHMRRATHQAYWYMLG